MMRKLFQPSSWYLAGADSNGKGDLVLPLHGYSIPLYAGDVVVFAASLVPHFVKMLASTDAGKRSVVTMFSCEHTKAFLEKHS